MGKGPAIRTKASELRTREIDMYDWVNPSEPHKLFIAGEWQSAQSGATYEDREPATGDVIAMIAHAEAEDVAAAISAAHAAQPAWEGMAPAARAECFYRAAELFNERRALFVEALIRESGSAFGKAQFEVSMIPMALREAAGLPTREIGEVLPSNVPGKINRTLRKARGVIGVVTPWNFPLYLGVRGFIYALALGNTVVLKPAQDTPMVGGLMLAELLQDAGFPAGVFNVITTGGGGASVVGDMFINDTRIAGISFTGSTGVGTTLALGCADKFKPVMLELGGKNSILVLEDADLDYAVEAAFFGAFLHQGQICMSADRIVVADAVYDSFLEKFVAKVRAFAPKPPQDNDCVIGPLINQKQVERLLDVFREAQEAGAVIECGGTAEGAFVAPTVITNVKPSLRLWREEIFGPATVVCRAASEQEAVALANDTEYGLSAAIITRDVAAGEALAEHIHAGMIHINDSTVHDEAHCPFSGLGYSGGGGKWGPKGAIEAFTEQRWISSMRQHNRFPF